MRWLKTDAKGERSRVPHAEVRARGRTQQEDCAPPPNPGPPLTSFFTPQVTVLHRASSVLIIKLLSFVKERLKSHRNPEPFSNSSLQNFL